MITNPTTGELLDRLIILKMKIQAARLGGLPHEHFCKEQDQVVGALAAKDSFSSRLFPHVLELTQVHKELWDAEDRRRSWAKKEWPSNLEASDILRDLGRLNAQRVALRESIDQILGEWDGAEKL